MQLNGVDANLKYLILTVLIILPVAGWHNMSLTEADEGSFGMCDISIDCQGAEVGDYCIGIESQQNQCVDPENAEQFRHVEAQCAVKAQGFCNDNPNMTGMDWTDHPNASFDGQNCAAWAEDDERIDLLSCEETFNDVTQW